MKLVPTVENTAVLSKPFMKLTPAAPVLKADNGIVCTICTLIVGFAEDKLESNATLAQIEIFLNTTVCHLLPSFLRPECASLMDEYAPQIAQKIEQGYPASVVCKDVGLCSSAAPVATKPLLKLVPTIEQMVVLKRPLLKLEAPIAKMAVLKRPLLKLVAPISEMKVLSSPFKKLVPAAPVLKADNGIVCTICTLIVGFAEDKLESNATLAEIETFLNTTVCGFLPSFLQPECQTLVDEYAPQIAQRIQQNYPAAVICKDIGLCVSAAKQKLVAAKTQNGIVCTICTLIVGYTEDRLGSNSTLAEIEEFLNTTVCGFLPSFLRPECASLVDEYAPQIAEKIFQGYPASVVCKDIGLCSTSKPAIVRPMLKLVAPIAQMTLLTEPLKKLVPAAVAPAGNPNGIECLVCRLVINAAEEELSNASTVEEVESFLNSTVCHMLPRLFRPECATLVDFYMPNLVAHIIAQNNATVVCTDVHAC